MSVLLLERGEISVKVGIATLKEKTWAHQELKKIEEHIKNNVLPKVKPDEKVRICFGKYLKTDFSMFPYPEYTLIVCGNGEIYFRVNELILGFHEEAKWSNSYIYDFWSVAKGVFPYWNDIKIELQNKIFGGRK